MVAAIPAVSARRTRLPRLTDTMPLAQAVAYLFLGEASLRADKDT